MYQLPINPSRPADGEIHVYTDGSSLSGKWEKVGAAGTVAAYKDQCWYSGYTASIKTLKNTNNNMELLALVCAMRQLKLMIVAMNQKDRPRIVRFRTDSQFSITVIEGTYKQWIEKQRISKTKQLEMIGQFLHDRRLLTQLGMKVTLEKVRAHQTEHTSTSGGNHTADLMASLALGGFMELPTTNAKVPRIENDSPEGMCGRCLPMWQGATAALRRLLRDQLKTRDRQ